MKELRGMPVVKALVEKYKNEAGELKEKGIIPKLVIVRVGEREDDLAYERGIYKRFAQAEVEVETAELPADVSQGELEKTLAGLNDDKNVHGILLFRPLPKKLDEERVKNLIAPVKDVDCMGDENMSHVFFQDGKGHAPCTPEAVMEMLKYYEVPLSGARAVVVGRSMVVGKPLAMMLLKENATVTVCHTKTKDLVSECQNADIILAAAGAARMIKKEHMKPGQVIMDVGINVVDGEMCGDVDYAAAQEVAEAASPVPGGVGTVTTTMLLKHVINSAKSCLQQISV